MTPRRRLRAGSVVGGLAAALLWIAGAAAAAGTAGQEGAAMSDAELDRLTAEVADQLRCPVCRNQSVLESSSELARSMQDVIRERLAAGESPEEVRAYFVARYGDWILLKPRARGVNLVVYLFPAALVLGGTWWVWRRLRAWRASRSGPRESRPARRSEAAGAGSSGRVDDSAGADAGPTSDDGLSEEDRAWLNDAIRTG